MNVGDFVREGQTLAKVDDRDAKIRLESARAAVRQAKAGVAQAEAKLGLLGGGKFSATTVPEVQTARANLEQARLELKQAEANEKRYRELTETGDVAMITYEQYRTARDTARARADAAQKQLETTINVARQSNQAIVSAQANVAAAQTQVDDAERVLADTVIRAPFSGYVSERPTSVGEYVSSSSVIATVLRTNPIKAIIQVPEADVPSVKLGAMVTISVDAYKDQNFAGKVSAVNPAIDQNSRAASIEALIDNGENLLRQGMFATARIVRGGGSKGVFVPKSAVYSDVATKSFRVFVIADGIAKLKVVQIGREEGDWQQIISGVDADETVATSNVDQLYEGAKVSS
ncbi:MAG: RND family efflux transporter MFP subunit [Acidobacteria bacterium OLB17]|nr:MAG: RND family efflux transporter MFP subunit [Acidobacteria bacterium OLB17]